jgi:hypothetical protein
MHQRSDDESIANYLSVKFHPDLIKIIGYWYFIINPRMN